VPPMPPTARLRMVAALIVLALAGSSGHAHAQDAAAAAKIEQLNKRAMGDYDMLEFESAKKTLTDALNLVKKSGLDGDPVAAKTYINLGIVYVARIKDRYKGFQQFVKALRIKPGATLDPAVRTPQLQQVF